MYVCRSLTVCHTSEPCNNPWTDRRVVWVVDSSGNHVLDGGSRSPNAKGQFWAGKGRPIGKYRDSLPWAVQKRLNRSRCRLGYGLGWLGPIKEACVRRGAHWRNLANAIEPSMCCGDAVFLSNYFDHLLLLENECLLNDQTSKAMGRIAQIFRQ